MHNCLLAQPSTIDCEQSLASMCVLCTTVYRVSFVPGICDHLQEVWGPKNDPGGGVQPDLQLAQVLL